MGAIALRERRKTRRPIYPRGVRHGCPVAQGYIPHTAPDALSRLRRRGPPDDPIDTSFPDDTSSAGGPHAKALTCTRRPSTPRPCLRDARTWTTEARPRYRKRRTLNSRLATSPSWTASRWQRSERRKQPANRRCSFRSSTPQLSLDAPDDENLQHRPRLRIYTKHLLSGDFVPSF